jgi:ribosome-binding ATPase YchF (GTP1/OBG family)
MVDMEIGIVGKPNVGKSTLFNALTKGAAQMANYPFTTIDPNRGVAYVRSRCPHVDFDVQCNPNNSLCEGGVRLVPVECIDVAGLVKGAHEGKGLGNQFLDHLGKASALIHVIDAAGSTDADGTPVEVGSHDPLDDVEFLEDEVAFWIQGILSRDFARKSKQMEAAGAKLHVALAERLTGLAITDAQVLLALKRLELPERPSTWTGEHLLQLARKVREISKPLTIAANKCDIAPPGNVERLKALKEKGYRVAPISAEVELALGKARKAGFVEYTPGSDAFVINEGAPLNPAQRKGLDKMAAIMKQMGGTGVTPLIEDVVFHVLDMIVIYPVEDESRYTDKQGRIFPDAHLVPKGTTAKEFAFRIHTDLGERFIRAIDVRSKRTVGADHVLRDRDVIKIIADA